MIQAAGYHLERSKLIEHSDDPFYLLENLLGKSSVNSIVDGGASIGDTSIKLSKLFPAAQVYAFEPYPPFIQSLKKKTMGSKQIKIEPFALDETEGKRMLSINESEGTNSFLQSEASKNHPYGDLMEKKGGVMVTSKTLDNWSVSNQLDSIDIIKLDLQGNELAALNGATQILEENKVKAILSEVSFISQYKHQPLAPEIMYMLNRHDFDLFNIYQIHYHHGRMIQADALFLHKSLARSTAANSKDLFLPHSKLIR